MSRKISSKLPGIVVSLLLSAMTHLYKQDDATKYSLDVRDNHLFNITVVYQYPVSADNALARVVHQ